MSTTTDPREHDAVPTSVDGGEARPADVASGRTIARDGRVDKLTWALAVANLIAQIGIIVTGGAVRLTGSGLGCSSWPMCEPGSFTPVFHEATSIHPYIEFGNRTLTGVLSVIAVALLWAMYRREPTASRPRGLRRLAWVPLVGIALQAVIGGMSVWYDLHPAIVGSHMLISLALVAASTYLLVRLRQGDGQVRWLAPAALRSVPWILTVLVAVVVTLGTVVTGSGPHSGDDSAAFRYAVDPVLIAKIHAWAVWLLVGASIGTAVALNRLRGNRALDGARRATWWLLAVLVLEGVIGYTQYFMGLPVLLVGLHMLGAALVVVAATFVCSAFYARDERTAIAASAL